MSTFTLKQIAEAHGVTRQAVAYQVKWRGLGTKNSGKIRLTLKELNELSFRQKDKNKRKYARRTK